MYVYASTISTRTDESRPSSISRWPGSGRVRSRRRRRRRRRSINARRTATMRENELRASGDDEEDTPRHRRRVHKYEEPCADADAATNRLSFVSSNLDERGGKNAARTGTGTAIGHLWWKIPRCSEKSVNKIVLRKEGRGDAGKNIKRRRRRITNSSWRLLTKFGGATRRDAIKANFPGFVNPWL